MCYNNPLGDAEASLRAAVYTPLLEGEATAISVSPRDDFAPGWHVLSVSVQVGTWLLSR